MKAGRAPKKFIAFFVAVLLHGGPALGGEETLLETLQTVPEENRPAKIRELFLRRGPEWTKAQKKNLLENFLKNSDGSYSGAVWASPSAGRAPEGHDPGEPDYRFHWTRDSAIAVETVAALLYYEDSTAEEKAQYRDILRAYVDFSRKVQQTPNHHEWAVYEPNHVRFVPAGAPGAVQVRFGEAKYRVVKKDLGDGRYAWEPAAFTDEWGRPQNDGPGLRATAVTRIARVLIEDQERLEKEGKTLSATDLATLKAAHEVLREDLSYVAARWRDPSYDLWEEVLGDHFFTRVVQSEALARGAKVLRRLGDASTAERLEKEQAEIEKSLDEFWDASKNHLVVTRNVRGGMRKDTDIDMAIVMAALRRPRGKLSASDPRVLATAMELLSGFKHDPAYEMNRKAGIPGVAGAATPRTRGPASGAFRIPTAAPSPRAIRGSSRRSRWESSSTGPASK